MKSLLRFLSLCCLWLASLTAQATSVVFLNPGYSTERFWLDYSAYMQDAADDLGMQLEVLYGERDPHKILGNARAVLQRSNKPDFLIFTNEQYVAPEVLRLFANSGIKLFALHSTLTPEQQELAGGSREKYSNWIGSLVPNDEEAGYLMGQALIGLAPGGAGEMVAFSGVKQTPSATLREAGLRRALAEHPQMRLRQMLYGEWKEQRAYEQATALLPRYPAVSLVWAANDEMAFGVIHAAQEQGRNLQYAALNNSQRVLQARVDGRISVLASGHFILGGCALVMLHDYAAGLDFARYGGKDQTARLFRLLDERQAQRLLHFDRRANGLDFRRFSATQQPQMRQYGFSIDAMLR
ncbi:LacI family transcriptional regulator [Pseudomonas alcaligenes]|uniref:LacI family transcriptional regulator n=1 Tax=Aquipseudomonas alcaligenes TaxID=43263 RepID=A0ABR7RZW9_AQUAC|nr:ABC transporter substrate-binding protein [Pseudomonas alcaligenes]MBC9250324.1 LacI family transcriptional regulator [Pseudomonas alcaligenes]